MTKINRSKIVLFIIVSICLINISCVTSISFSLLDTDSHTEQESHETTIAILPVPINTYNDEHYDSIFAVITHRIRTEPFNLAATLVFVFAITHILSASWFKEKAHKYEHEHQVKIHNGKADSESHSLLGGIFHFLGEVEAIFGIWTLVLALAVTTFYDWDTFVTYVGKLNYKEPMYTVVIMTIASSRPILKFVELLLWRIVKLFGGTLEVWWLSILILAPLSASFITEPAAITIGAFLLAEKFYALKPNSRLKYATLALLFVNISMGGLLTNFASHPILMVAHTWHWSSWYTFKTFGINAVLSILLSTSAYYVFLRHDIKALKEAYAHERYKKYIQRRFISKKQLERSFDILELEVNSSVGFTSQLDEWSNELKDEILSKAYDSLHPDEMDAYNIHNAIEEKFDDIRASELKRTIPGLLPEDMKPHYRDPYWDNREDRVPLWIMLVHVAFISWTVMNANVPVLFIGGFLFFLGFFQITAYYQNRMNLKPALLVAFFIAGIIIHGSLQGWWIEAVLSQLPESTVSVSALLLSSLNDNASITYLGTLVPDLTEAFKYAIVAGTVTGGGLTVIANSPNPVGVSILKKHFKHGVSALELVKYALLPTILSFIVFFCI